MPRISGHRHSETTTMETSQLVIDVHMEDEREPDPTQTDTNLEMDLTTYESQDMSLTQTHNNSYADVETGGKDRACKVYECQVTSRCLKCDKCEGRVHYKCSLLPDYQIINLAGSNRRYTCKICTAIKTHILEAIQAEGNATDTGNPSLQLNLDKLSCEHAERAKSVDTACQTESTAFDASSPNNPPATVVGTTCQTDLPEGPGGADTSTDLTRRMGDLEQTLTKLVQGLCEDITDSRIQTLKSELKASRSEVQNLQSKQEIGKRKIRDLEKQRADHVCEVKCSCEEKLRDAATKALEMETRLEQESMQIKSMQEEIQSLRATNTS